MWYEDVMQLNLLTRLHVATASGILILGQQSLADLRGGAWRAHAPPPKIFKVCMTVDDLINFT